MSDYCTYFDRGYLAQGVALWESLARHDPGANLTVLALDDDTATVMGALAPGRVNVVRLPDLLASDPALAAAQANRSRTEFIFSLTPSLARHVLAQDAPIDRIVYLDADLFFFGSPSVIWSEWGEGSVYIVPHRYPRWHDDSALYGRFNVGVVGFRRDDAGQACLDLWRQQCLAATTLAADGSTYGDQKYLDAWPASFPGVVASAHPGVNLAPWNWAAHRCDIVGGHVLVEGRPLVVFHFAQFKRVSADWFDSGQLEYGIMPSGLRSRLYGEYWQALEKAEGLIRQVLPAYAIPRRGWPDSLGNWRMILLRMFWGQFWFRARGSWRTGRLGLGRFSGRMMGTYRRWQRGPR